MPRVGGTEDKQRSLSKSQPRESDKTRTYYKFGKQLYDAIRNETENLKTIWSNQELQSDVAGYMLKLRTKL